MFKSALCFAGLMMMSAPAAAQIPNEQFPPPSVTCGQQIGSVTKFMRQTLSIPVVDLSPLPHAYATVRVPVGKTRCIKVRFTYQGICHADLCWIAATVNGRQMLGGQYIHDWAPVHENGVYEFTNRVSAGMTYKVEIRVAVYDLVPPQTEEEQPLTFWMTSWVLDVSSYY